MGEFRVVGGKKLFGSVAIGGCKNAVLPILAAAVLTGGEAVIKNCPNILDTQNSIEILRFLGCAVKYDGSVLVINSKEISGTALPAENVGKMRSSIIFAGALLARFGEFETVIPGGCRLGARPIDIHLDAFAKMGVILHDDGDIIRGKVAKRLKGAEISLPFPSVGAKQNIMLAATLANGTTTISNAAKEPEIVDLQNFLVAAGAEIFGAGSSKISINGVKKMNDVSYKIMPDRIVASTYLAAAAATRGKICLQNVRYRDIIPVVKVFAAMGAHFKLNDTSLIMDAGGNLTTLPLIKTAPHPGFPTDVQPQMTAFLATLPGTSLIEENLFEARYAHISQLVKMGANIEIKPCGRLFEINGTNLKAAAASLEAKDLRSGAALIIAGLAAEGTTTVKNAHYVQRGYEDIVGDLQNLGAEIAYLS